MIDTRTRFRRPAAAALSTLLLLYALPVLIAPAHFIQDDAYFYLQVAHNVAAGNGSTFHQLTPTNGYHPLWLLACTAISALAPDKGLALHLAITAQVLLVAALAWCFRAIAVHLWPGIWQPGLALLVGFLLVTTVYASEAALNALLLTAGIHRLVVASATRGDRAWLFAGATLGLAVLARLDNLFVVATLITAASLVPGPAERRDRLRRALLVSASAALVLAPYLLYNVVSTGHLVPISGAIKSSLPLIEPDFDRLGTLGQVTAVGGALSLLMAAFTRRRGTSWTILAGMGAGVLVHAAYVVLLTDHYTFWKWYYVAGVLNLAFVLCAGFDLVADRRRSLARVAATTATLALVFAALSYGWMKAHSGASFGPVRLPELARYRWPSELGRWMKLNLPPGSAVFVYDYPGALAYHSDRRVLPVDGLINDYTYNDELMRIGIEAYLCAKGVDFYLGPRQPQGGVWGPRGELHLLKATGGVQEVEVQAPLYRQPAGRLRLVDDAIVVEVREILQRPDQAPPLAIWRLDPCAAQSRS